MTLAEKDPEPVKTISLLTGRTTDRNSSTSVQLLPKLESIDASQTRPRQAIKAMRNRCSVDLYQTGNKVFVKFIPKKSTDRNETPLSCLHSPGSREPSTRARLSIVDLYTYG